MVENMRTYSCFMLSQSNRYRVGGKILNFLEYVTKTMIDLNQNLRNLSLATKIEQR